MIKQDYLIRMIQEIVSLIVNAILNKKKIRQKEWEEYDEITRQLLGFPTRDLLNMSTEELIGKCGQGSDKMEKIELAAMNMLKLSEDIEDNLLLKSRLLQNGIQLLKHVQKEGNAYSLQREYLIKMLELQ